MGLAGLAVLPPKLGTWAVSLGLEKYIKTLEAAHTWPNNFISAGE
jgi:hypothetical protein